MIVPAAPLVPHDENCGRVPERTFADGVHDVGDPLRAGRASTRAVVGVPARRRHPGDRCQAAPSDVGDHARRRTDDVLVPIGSEPNMSDRAVRKPLRRLRSTIHPPTQTSRREFVAQRPVVTADRNRATVGSPVGQRSDEVVGRAAPDAAGIVNRAIRLARDHILVRNVTEIEVRRKHPVGQDVCMGHREVDRGLRARNVAVLRVRWTRLVAVQFFAIEAVHAAVRAGKGTRAVARREVRG